MEDIRSHTAGLSERHEAMAAVVREEIQGIDPSDPRSQTEMRGWVLFVKDLSETAEAGRSIGTLIEEAYRHVLARRSGVLDRPEGDWDKLLVFRSSADIKRRLAH
ncbi:MAG: hypothetical protein WD276_06735 [Actinomycetota bacterium]